MKSLGLEEENIITDIRNIFKLKTKTKLHCRYRYKKSF